MTAADVAREEYFAAGYLEWASYRMAPGWRTKAKGIAQAKPDSPLQAFYGFRRVIRSIRIDLY